MREGGRERERVATVTHLELPVTKSAASLLESGE